MNTTNFRGDYPITPSAVGFLSVLASSLDAQTNQLSGSTVDTFTSVFDSIATGALDFENALAIIKLLKFDLDDGQGGYDADFSTVVQLYGDAEIAQPMLYLYQNSYDTSNMVTGTEGADSISGTAADDFLMGRAGDDNLSVGSGDNVLFGGTGDDTIIGGTGNDKYIYRFGDGNDVITDINSSQDQDTLSFMDVAFSDVVFSQNAEQDLVLTMVNGETITITDYFSSTSNEIEFIEFSDGTVLDADAIMASLGTSGNDIFYSWGKSDTFTFRAGQGDDQIVSSSHNYAEVDTLRFEDGVTAADLYSVYVGNDLKIGFKASDGSITIVNDALDGSNASIYQLTTFTFADGTSMSRQDFMNATLGTAGNDVFNGSGENDTFVLRAGQGDDQIVSSSHNYAEVDTLRFEDGVTAADVFSFRADLDGNGVDDLVIAFYAADGSMSIMNGLSTASNANIYEVDQFVFSDGTSYSFDQFITATDDQIAGDNYLFL